MPSKRVLIVDDEQIVQEIVQNCFEDLAGWKVLTANSGEEGLQKALAEKPDAIVLDMMMPGMDGLTFLQFLKADPAGQIIPVVLLTAKVDFADPICCQKLSVSGAIVKPFDPIQLVSQIATILGWSLEE